MPFVHTSLEADPEEGQSPPVGAVARSSCEDMSKRLRSGMPPYFADIVYKNGAICTMDAARNWCQALAIYKGKIACVGSDRRIEAEIGPSTRVIDLNGRMVLPGFHDTHVHLAEGGVELSQLSLEGCADIAEAMKRLKEYAEKNPDQKWILGGNWALTLFPHANPKKETLDEVVKDRPVFLISNDGHSAWANSKALQLSGVTDKTADPPLGRIERSEKNGQPSGALREAAMDLIRRKSPKITEAQMLEGTTNAIKYANSFGITHVTEANAGEDILKAYKRLVDEGALNLKIRAAVETDPQGNEKQVNRSRWLKKKYEGGRLCVGEAKFFADGVVETHTASLLTSYLDKKEETGISNWTDEKFAKLATEFERAGFQIHIHAIGDKAVRQALNSIEAARKANGDLDLRPHIAHLQLIDKADMPRFRKLGVTATFQPLWAYRDVFVKDLTVPVLGEERTNSMYPINSLLKQGAVLSAGSDWTVSSLNPLDAIEVAVTRKGLFDKPEDYKDEPLNLDERVNLMDILAAYTCGGAYVDHSDRETGSLEPGKAADLIVLDKNLFDIPNTDIHKVKVLQTMIDGEIVFDRECQAANPEAVKERF
ncbi:MAG: amidohydrolase [Candidatus Melainabacteria bacterium]|nr:amidohydrolase [Candidatus Melainabacteria bacterium]